MNSTVQGRVEYCAERGQTIFSPLSSSDVAAVIHTGSNRDGEVTYDVLMPDGTAFNLSGNECSCGSEIEVEPASEVTQWRRRLGQACEHQKAQLKAAHVGGICPDCGELKVEETTHTNSRGVEVMATYNCVGCGTSRSER